MLKVSITEAPMERCLVNMPYEIVFEIFRRLPKGYLMRLSKLWSKFRDVAEDTRLWKNVYIKYDSVSTYEELYSQPWPVKVIDLSHTLINPPPPVSLQNDQVVIKVTELKLSSINAAYNKCTMEAIFAKYQCTKLLLDFNIFVGPKGDLIDIAPETILKQSTLEVLKVVYHRTSNKKKVTVWLAQVLSNCKNLKTLDLSYTSFYSSDMLRLVKSVPTSFEKLLLIDALLKGSFPKDSFFKSLAEINPNLKELGFTFGQVLLPSLLQFHFLETLRITLHLHQYINIDSMYMYLIKFPALKTVYVDDNEKISLPLFPNKPILGAYVEKLRGKLEPHDIKIEIVEFNEVGPEFDANDYNCWRVSKAV